MLFVGLEPRAQSQRHRPKGARSQKISPEGPSVPQSLTPARCGLNCRGEGDQAFLQIGKSAEGPSFWMEKEAWFLVVDEEADRMKI